MILSTCDSLNGGNCAWNWCTGCRVPLLTTCARFLRNVLPSYPFLRSLMLQVSRNIDGFGIRNIVSRYHGSHWREYRVNFPLEITRNSTNVARKLSTIARGLRRFERFDFFVRIILFFLVAILSFRFDTKLRSTRFSVFNFFIFFTIKDWSTSLSYLPYF